MHVLTSRFDRNRIARVMKIRCGGCIEWRCIDGHYDGRSAVKPATFYCRDCTSLYSQKIASSHLMNNITRRERKIHIKFNYAVKIVINKHSETLNVHFNNV